LILSARAARLVVGAVVLVVAGGGGVLWRRSGPPAPSSRAAPAEPLPVVAVATRDVPAITRIELTRPDDDDRSRLVTIALEKRGPAWHLTAPIAAQASAPNVEALIANLQTLHLWKVVDPGTAFYDQYDLTQAKALHVTVW